MPRGEPEWTDDADYLRKRQGLSIEEVNAWIEDRIRQQDYKPTDKAKGRFRACGRLKDGRTLEVQFVWVDGTPKIQKVYLNVTLIAAQAERGNEP